MRMSDRGWIRRGGRIGRAAVWVAGLALGSVALFAPAATAQHAELHAARDAIAAEEAARALVFERASSAVVCIFDEPTTGGGGSGVIIDPRGYGLTNYHVVASFLETRLGLGGLRDGRLYPLRVLAIDPGGDVALFKLEGRERFEYAPLGDSDALVLGQPVAAMGNPFTVAEDFQPTITLGMISGLRRYQEGQENWLEYADCIQVSSSINPGNSGGPLFDLAGRVIGINGRASFEERGRVNVGLGYAISINQIKRFLPALRSGALALHGTLNATVIQSGDELIFNRIQTLGAADRAGVEIRDVLLAIDDRALHTPNDFNNAIATRPADWPVRLRIRRGGEELVLETRLDPLRLKTPFVWLPDRDATVAVLRDVVARYRSASHAVNWPRAGRITISGTVAALQGDAEYAFGVESALDGTGTRSVMVDVVDVAGDAPPARQFAEVVSVLWREIPSVANWRHVGGDLVDGQVADVIEYRANDETRTRWKIAANGGALLEVTIGDEEQPRTIAWTPDPELISAADGAELPLRWVRRTDGEVDWVINVLELQIEPGSAAPQSAEVDDASDRDGRAAESQVSNPPPTSHYAAAITATRPRVVKLYGAGIGRTKAYGTGIVVSADGRILTVMTALLESPMLNAVFDDGRRLPARVVRRDETRRLALLEVDSADPLDAPCFDLAADAPELAPGEPVLAAANVFRVADGPEAVSFSAGAFGGLARLDARRRTQDFPYTGDVLLTDVIVATPGSAGGALVDVRGALVGMIGPMVISNATNTWLNYALPTAELRLFVDGGDSTPDGRGFAAAEASGLTPVAFGIRLFDVGGRVRPAYVERVRAGTPADAAGVMPDDLIISINNQSVQTCDDVRARLAALRTGAAIELLVKRGDDVVMLNIPVWEPQ